MIYYKNMISLKRFSFLVFVAFCAVANGAQAATIGVDEQNKCYLLNSITPEDPPILEQALKSGCTQLDVLSRGGDVNAALMMGRMIRRNKVGVAVPSVGSCESACVFLYAAGVIRVNYGPVRIHRPYYNTAHEDFRKTQADYRKLESEAKKFLRDMNVSEVLFDKMMAIRPEDVMTLTLSEMQEMGMGLQDPVYAEYVDNRAAAAAGLSKVVWLQKKRAATKACGEIERITLEGEYEKLRQCWESSFPEYFRRNSAQTLR